MCIKTAPTIINTHNYKKKFIIKYMYIKIHKNGILRYIHNKDTNMKNFIDKNR